MLGNQIENKQTNRKQAREKDIGHRPYAERTSHEFEFNP